MNKQAITITGTVKVWLTNSRETVDDITNAAAKDPQEAIDCLGYGNADMDKGSYPWTKVGTAEITITLMPRDEVAAAQIKTLNEELQQERAASMQRQNAIMDRISKLQALTFDGAEVA